MLISKVLALFNRSWKQVAETSGRALPAVLSMTGSPDPDDFDVTVAFDGPVGDDRDLLVKTGCKVVYLRAAIADLIVPTAWISTPSRRMLVSTDTDQLHNDLLDAGVEDWIIITPTENRSALEVMFIEHLSTDQISRLKGGYDVLAFDNFTYTFVKRNSTQPLADPVEVEKRLRRAWSNAHAGKIAAVGSTDDPREWIVTTEKAQPSHTGLAQHGIEHQKLIDPKTARVRIGSKLWLELITLAAVDTTEEQTGPNDVECSADLLLQFFVENKYKEMGVNLNYPHVIAQYDTLVSAGLLEMVGEVVDLTTSKWQDYKLTAEGIAFAEALMNGGVSLSDVLFETRSEFPDDDLRDIDTDGRDQVIEQLKKQNEELQHIVRTLTPVTDEWQTLKISLPKDGKIIAHPEIAAEQGKGWKIHHIQYAPNGEDRLFVFMERRALPVSPVLDGIRVPRVVTVGSPVHALGGRYHEMVEEMNAAIAPTVDALHNALKGW